MRPPVSSKPELQEIILGFRKVFIHIGVFSFAINLLMLIPSIYMLQVYDRVLSSRNETTLLLLTALILGLYVLMSSLEWIRSHVLVRVGNSLDLKLASRTFTAAFQRNLGQRGGNPAQALHDLTQVRQFLTGSGTLAFFDAPWIPLYLLVTAFIHPLLGLATLVGALILLALAFINELSTHKLLDEATKASIASSQFANNNLRNAEVIEALGMLGNLRIRWQKKQAEFLSLQSQASDRAGIISSITKFFRISLQSLILGIGAWLALKGEITPGGMIAGSILMGRAVAPVEQLISIWKHWISAKSAYARLNELLATYPASSEALSLPTPNGAISIENVTATAPGTNNIILNNLSFRANPSDVIAIIGPSAAGKSSLARILVGVWKPVKGTVRLDGADVATWNKEELGPSIGYMPQDIELFEGNVAENIARFGELDSTKIIEAAQLAGVHELILRLPQGYDTQTGIDGNFLSGGQKQRIALARALYGDSKLVVLDEPNSNLDEAGETALVKAIQQLKSKGCTVFVVSHRTNILAVVDKLLWIRDGALVAYGPRDEVLAFIQQGPQAATPSNSARKTLPHDAPAE